MVHIMKEEWDCLLLDKSFDDCDPLKRQPRLEELYDRILIKAKRLDESRGTSEANEGQSASIIDVKPPICEALASLAIYTYSQHYDDDNSLGNCKSPSHIFTMSEDTLSSLAAQEAKLDKIIAHNRDFLMHIHPKERRVRNSNPDPTTCWPFGVQMVAMNLGTTDRQIMLNGAMFAGTNGWVLKPRSLLGGDFATTTTTSEASSSPLSNRAPPNILNLEITVLAGQSLPFPDGGDRGGGIRRLSERFGITIGRSVRPKVRVEVRVARLGNRTRSVVKETAAARAENPDWGRKADSMKFLRMDVMEELSFVW